MYTMGIVQLLPSLTSLLMSRVKDHGTARVVNRDVDTACGVQKTQCGGNRAGSYVRYNATLSQKSRVYKCHHQHRHVITASSLHT